PPKQGLPAGAGSRRRRAGADRGPAARREANRQKGGLARGDSGLCVGGRSAV
ncbi:hypothetical protein H4S02_006486, partial [Coemansia sp. RSA 2611]